MPIISNQTLSSLDVAKLAQFFLLCKSLLKKIPPPATNIPNLHQSDQLNFKNLLCNVKFSIQHDKKRPQVDSPSSPINIDYSAARRAAIVSKPQTSVWGRSIDPVASERRFVKN